MNTECLSIYIYIYIYMCVRACFRITKTHRYMHLVIQFIICTITRSRGYLKYHFTIIAVNTRIKIPYMDRLNLILESIIFLL